MMERFGYGASVTTHLDFDPAVARVKELLKSEGFGVLCEIDVAATMKEKLGETVPPYVILGACNPQLAHRALAVENQLGLLLPCNVVVQRRDGATVVSAIDAAQMMNVVANSALAEVAADANERLGRVLSGLSN